MKQIAICLLLVCASTAAKSEIIKGIFYYTSSAISGSGGIIVDPPSPAASPALYIFNTETQQVKVFNFVESGIQFDYDKRTFNVSRRIGNEPITTQAELTDLSVCEWHLYAQYTDEYDIEVIGECTFREDGSWTFATQYLFGPHGYHGDIIEFDDYTSPSLEKSSVECLIGIGNARAYLHMIAPLGLKHKILRSGNLHKWEEVALDSDYANLTESGHIISDGIYSYIHENYLSSSGSMFYKVESSIIEYTD